MEGRDPRDDWSAHGTWFSRYVGVVLSPRRPAYEETKIPGHIHDGAEA